MELKKVQKQGRDENPRLHYYGKIVMKRLEDYSIPVAYDCRATDVE